MASKYEKEYNQDFTEEEDGILPEDSASNISAPTSMTSSTARQYRNQRAAATLKLKMIEEEAAFEEMEQNMELATVHDERELRRKRREAKIEADLLAAKIKAEKKRIDAEKNKMEAKIQAQKQIEELEEEEALKQLEAEQRRNRETTNRETEIGGPKSTYGSRRVGKYGINEVYE